MVEIVLTEEARANLERVPLKMLARMHALIERLEKYPEVSGLKKLKGQFAGSSRLRSGDWHLIFRVEAAGTRVVIERIAHRKDVYDD
jgi:mRNA-degrading endonuclease RelE of RelBE toxin-antitoxin system